MAEANNTKLFAEFPEISTQQWMDKITADLKGADFERKLVWRTNEGFNVQPFYRQEDLENVNYLDVLPGEFPFVRGSQKDNNWFVRQNILVKDVKAANKKALNILNKGVDSLGFIIEDADLCSVVNVATLLEGICLSAVELNFTVMVKSKEFVENFMEVVENNGYKPEDIKGSLNWDCFGRLLCKGVFRTGSLQGDMKEAAELIEMSSAFSNFRVLTVNAKYFNNAGSFISQELGFGLAMGNEYLSLLTEAGVDASAVAANLKFNFAVGSNYFMEIAKFRAARLAWANIVAQYTEDKTSAVMNIHAETSNWNKTVFDPYVNMLRTQTEAMSASLGGVNSLTVLPFDSTYKISDEFSERIARNQQHLLKEESHFDKVADPSAGSYYIETLTDNILDQGWKIFLSVEDNGGLFASLKDGMIQAEVKKAADKRCADIANRKEVLLGTTQYPNTNETMAGEIKKSGSCCSCASSDAKKEIETLSFARGTEAFEALRLQTEAAAKRPKVVMLKVGNLAMRQARGQFAGNFFGCAGYEISDTLGYNSVEEGVKAAKEKAADIVVLCSSDDEYAAAAPLAKDLLDDEILVIAGAPKCADELKAKGIENFIHVRSNVLEELKGYNLKLGIK